MKLKVVVSCQSKYASPDFLNISTVKHIIRWGKRNSVCSCSTVDSVLDMSPFSWLTWENNYRIIASKLHFKGAFNLAGVCQLSMAACLGGNGLWLKVNLNPVPCLPSIWTWEMRMKYTSLNSNSTRLGMTFWQIKNIYQCEIHKLCLIFFLC